MICLNRWNLACFCVAGAVTVIAATACLASPPEVVLELKATRAYPRRGEGDLLQLRNGTVLFYYTRFTALQKGDFSPAHIASRVSKDGGCAWSSKGRVVVPNNADMNLMSVSLLRLRDGRIALFYCRKNSMSDCRPVVRFSDDEARTWSEEKTMISDDHVGYYVLNNDRVIQLQSGRLIAPVSRHNGPDWERWTKHGHQMCYLSDDDGQNWRRSTTVLTGEDVEGQRIMLQEPGVIELDGGQLMMWCRTDQGRQYVSYSEDGGDTWSSLAASNIVSPRSPASLERIPSTGDLLLVWNHRDVTKKVPRTPLTVAVSKNEGRTWSHEKTVETDPEGVFCYTAIAFVDEHVLLSYYTGGGSSRILRVPLAWIYK